MTNDLSLRREAEKQARILQSVLDSMDQGVVVADSRGRVLLCNPAADRIAGVALSQLPLRAWIEQLGLFLADGVTPFPPHELPLARALRGEETPEVVMCLRAAGRDRPVYVNIKGRPLCDHEGRPWGGMAVFRDVTAELEAEKVLRDYARQIEDMYNRAPCGYHSLDPDGTFVLINDTELSWLGYHREELIGRRKFVELLTTEGVEDFRRNFPIFLERGWIRDLEYELIRKDGTSFDVVLNATAVYDEQRRFVMTRSTLVDNTERKRAERRISARHAVFRILAESASLAEAAPRVLESIGVLLGWDAAALWSVDPRTNLPRLAASWSAREPRDATGLPAEALELPGVADDLVNRVLAHGRPEWFPRLDRAEPDDGGAPTGAASVQSACAVPILHQGGALGVFTLFRGSPREPDELMMGLLASMSEQISHFIEAKQLQERMIQSERLASIGVLSAGVAHEINNPLSFVSNNLAVLDRDCRLLLDLISAYRSMHPDVEAEELDGIRRSWGEADLDELPERLSRLMASTRKGVERVAGTVRHLRGFARLDQAVIDRVNLRDCVSSTLGLMEARLARAGIRLKLRMAEIPAVECAPAQVNQVLMNLLNNAIQAIEATGRADGCIEVATYPAGGEVVVEVSDNGCGIPSNVLGRIFDPFFTTRGVGEGSGLGLSISHGIISEHGGRIEVDSEVGQGTRFRVALPITGRGAAR